MKTRIFALLAVVIAFLTWSASAPAGEPGWPDSLTIATASPGGTYHVYGEGLARLLSGALDMPVNELTTEGPSQNIELIEAGKVQLAFVTMGVAQQAWNGTGEWTHGKQYRSIRALFPMYATPFQFVVLKTSAVQSLADLAGKRIGVGPQGGTSGTYIPSFLSTLGIEATLIYGTYDEQAGQLQDGSIDVLAAAAGAPFPAVAGLDARKEVRFVPVSKEQILALRLAIPELTAVTIAPGTYPSLLKSYQTVGLYNFAIASAKLPIDLVYRIVDVVFANRDAMMEVHPAAAATVPGNFIYNTFLPYHEGASRYYANLSAAGALRSD